MYRKKRRTHIAIFNLKKKDRLSGRRRDSIKKSKAQLFPPDGISEPKEKRKIRKQHTPFGLLVTERCWQALGGRTPCIPRQEWRKGGDLKKEKGGLNKGQRVSLRCAHLQIGKMGRIKGKQSRICISKVRETWR